MSLDLFQLLPAVYKICDAELAAAKPLLTRGGGRRTGGIAGR